MSCNPSPYRTRVRRAALALVWASLFLTGGSAFAKGRPAPQPNKQQQSQPQQLEPQPPQQQQAPAALPQQAPAAAGPSGETPAKAGDAASAQDAPPAPLGEERRSIGEYVRSHLADITSCYDDRLALRKGLEGKLMARFDIGPDGRVITASAEGIDDRELIRCTTEAMRRWRFEKPASGGKLRVAYPFVFRPEATL